MRSPLASLSAYPGRGVVLSRSGEGGLRWVYFVTGRSASSKARRFVVRRGSLAVAPAQTGAAPDDLRHYVCVTGVADTEQIVIGNGDHVSQIARSIERGTSLSEAVEAFEPEPDPPINTPRIAAVLDGSDASLVAIRRTSGRTERRVEPVVLDLDEGLVLHTYGGSSERPIGSAPQFRFHPPSDLRLPEVVWHALHPDRRVMLAAGSSTAVAPTLVLP